MKKIGLVWSKALIATAGALMVPVSAYAQSGVTLYGIVDTGVEYLTNANKTSHSLVQLQDGNIQESRWGIRAREDLGDGWQASVWLESGFDETKGTLGQGSRLFGRQAALGLSGHDNELWLGRVYNPIYDVLNGYDPTTYAQYSLATLDPGLVSRGDQSIRYTRTLGDFRLTGFYSMGYDSIGTPIGGTAGGASTAKDLAFAAQYKGPVFSGVLAYDNLHGPLSSTGSGLGTLSAGLTPATSVPGDRARRYVAAASVNVAKWVFMAGYRLLKTEFLANSVNSNLYWGGARVKVSPALTLIGSVYHVDVPGKDVKATNTVFSAMYALSKNTYLYSNASYAFNSKNSTMGVDVGGMTLAGKNQLGIQAGIFQRF